MKNLSVPFEGSKMLPWLYLNKYSLKVYLTQNDEKYFDLLEDSKKYQRSIKYKIIRRHMQIRMRNQSFKKKSKRKLSKKNPKQNFKSK